MRFMKKLVLVGLVLLASVVVLMGCKNDSVPEIADSQVGYIAYSDGSISSEYDSSKTPVGIVFDVDETGSATKIVALTETNLQWCIHDSYLLSEDVSRTDGLLNLTLIKEKDDWASTFPAFEYCANFNSTNWYLPAIDELNVLCQVKTKVNKAIEKIGSETAILIGDGEYWSSTKDDGWSNALFRNFNEKEHDFALLDSYKTVRPIRSF